MMRETEGLTEITTSSRVFSRLLTYMKPHRLLLFGAFVTLAVGVIASVLGPVIMRTFIDKYLTPERFPVSPLVFLGASYLLLQIIAAVCQYVQMVWFQQAALKMIQKLRMDVFGKVQHLGLAFFDKTPTGVLVSRITNDTEAIKDFYVSVLSSFVQNIIMLIGIFITMFALNFRLALYMTVLAPMIVVVMAIYRRVSGKVFHVTRRRLSLLNAKLNESLQGMYLIQAMRQQKRLQREFGEINHQYFVSRLKNIRINSFLLRPLMDVIYLSTLVLVLDFFGIRSQTSTVDVGVIYAFVNYLGQFFEPVNDMMERLNIFQQAMVAGSRVFQLLDQTEMAPTHTGNGSVAIRRGKVTFDNVTFSYDGLTDVLKNISFTANPGETVALVGHTGSGKSSIVNLLLRFYSIRQGRILIDDTPLEAFPDSELRSNIGLVLQDPFLFVGDVAGNIRLGTSDITDEQVYEAARFVQADEFIQRFPKGYQEPVRERGATFSGGQRQLISFARTMAIEPKILVLDEATASVDTETEDAIQTALQRMRRGRTTIAIAHRLSTIQDADLILVLHHGEIVERGTHQELLAEEGLYHKMYLLQQGGREVAAAN